jgi:hypothetical protein
VDVKQWIVQEALGGRYSMNKVVVEAMNTKINLTFGETQNKEARRRHRGSDRDGATAKRAAILTKSSYRQREDILVQTPSRADFVPLARVSMTTSPSRQMLHRPKPMGAWG